MGKTERQSNRITIRAFHTNFVYANITGRKKYTDSNFHFSLTDMFHYACKFCVCLCFWCVFVVFWCGVVISHSPSLDILKIISKVAVTIYTPPGYMWDFLFPKSLLNFITVFSIFYPSLWVQNCILLLFQFPFIQLLGFSSIYQPFGPVSLLIPLLNFPLSYLFFSI